MSIAPFSTPAFSPSGGSTRTRLALVIATVGIAATLLAYAISPNVRRAVGHAEHSVRHAVSHVFDHHHNGASAQHKHKPVLHLVQPLLAPSSGHSTRKASARHAASSQPAPPGVASPSD